MRSIFAIKEKTGGEEVELSSKKKFAKDEKEKAEYMIDLYKLNRKALVCSRRQFMKDLMADDEFYEKLKQMGDTSQNIIFLSVFAYYRRCKEKYGE